MTYSNGVRKPSELIDDVLTGKTPVDKADPSIRLALEREVWNRAEQVLAAGDRIARAEALAKVEEPIREMVRAKAAEMFEARKAKR